MRSIRCGHETCYHSRCTSCVRDVTPSLRNVFRRWYSTLLGLMHSWAAMSRFVIPRAARRATCASCAVS